MLRFLYPLLCLCCVLLLTACSEPLQPPLRIGTNVWPGYEPLYLARELGYLNSGDAHLVEYASATQVIRAFRNETIDAAALTLDEVLLLAQDGFAPRIVLVMDISAGGDAIVGQSAVRSMQDLRGRRIGVENTALGSYVLARALELNLLSVGDVQIVPMDVNEHEANFMGKAVDAVVTFDPVRSRLLQSGGKLLFDSRQIPGEVMDVLIVRASALEKGSDRVRGILDAWFQALNFFSGNPREASEIMAKRLTLSAEDVLDSYQGLLLPSRADNLKMLAMASGELPAIHATAERMIEMMERMQLLQKRVDTQELFVPPLFK